MSGAGDDQDVNELEQLIQAYQRSLGGSNQPAGPRTGPRHRHHKHDDGDHAPRESATSDLSIDETLLLHSMRWEPVDLVSGVAVVAIPPSSFVLGWNDTDAASASFANAVELAVRRLAHAAGTADGVVGVHVDFEVEPHKVTAILVGTAVRPSDPAERNRNPFFVSDLSTRDFCLLHHAGWAPVGLAYGASFVQVPRRSAGAVMRQMTANTELTNLTGALYEARETAMERMQADALRHGGTGMVAVNVSEGPLPFASHVVLFTAYGTAIRLIAERHNYLRPRMVLPLNDREQLFDVSSLGAE